MKDKVCLVTGATSGIGEVTARELAAKGATVIVVGRSEARARETVDAIRKATGSESVSALIADLSSRRDVATLADQFLAKHDRLDVLMNNAGAVYYSRQESVDGVEMTLALNHLGYFDLTRRLLEILKKTPGARVVSVASGAHHKGTIRFDDLQGKLSYNPLRAYAQSKLANVLFTRELAARLSGTGVTANCLHPGVVATRIGEGNRSAGIISFGMNLFFRIFGISAERGARTMLHLATSPDVAKVTGQYFSNEREARISREAQDAGVQRRLWEVTEDLLK